MICITACCRSHPSPAACCWICSWRRSSALLSSSAIDRARPEIKAFLWLLLGTLLTWMLVRDAVVLISALDQSFAEPSFNFTLWVPLLALFAGAVAVLGWRHAYPPAARWLAHGLRRSLAIAGCAVLILVPQLLSLAARSQALEQDSFRRVPAQPASALKSDTDQGRILWILLDEFSYDQGFAHRQPSVKLPNFDALAAESSLFTNLQPVGYYTEEVVPSLLLGRRVEALRSNFEGMPRVQYSGQNGWTAFDAGHTIFGDAQRLGWSTGVAGWYNPYCRILSGVLDSCYWTFGNAIPSGLSGRKTVLGNAVAILPGVEMAEAHMDAGPQSGPAAGHWDEYSRLMARSRALVADTSIRFVLLHLPLPHPPGLYDRRTQQFSLRGSYLDNLALADRAVGELLDVMHNTPAAANTTVIVSSDHSWRVLYGVLSRAGLRRKRLPREGGSIPVRFC